MSEHRGTGPVATVEDVCPVCLEPLAKTSCWTCLQCGVAFPLVEDHIPVLVTDPQGYIARQMVEVSHDVRFLRRAAAEHRRASRRSENEHALIEMSAAYLEQATFLGSLVAPALANLPADCLLDAFAESTPGGASWSSTRSYNAADLVIRYAYRDWSQEDLCELEVRTTVEAVTKALEGCVGPLLVVGSGAGRVARELAMQFDETIAIDLSLAMALLYRRLETDGLYVPLISPRNRKPGACSIKTTSLKATATEGSRFRYVVADATVAPWRHDTFGTVVSVCFSDVPRLSRLCSEALRLLRPGGAFVHFGPLQYHHEHPEEHWTTDQFVANIAAAGFEHVSMEGVATTHLFDSESLKNVLIDNLVIRGEKPRQHSLVQDPAMSQLSFSHSTWIQSAVRFAGGQRTDVDGLLTTAAGHSIPLTAWQQQLLFAIGSGRSGADPVLAMLDGAVGEPTHRRDDATKFVQSLMRQGVLRSSRSHRVAEARAD